MTRATGAAGRATPTDSGPPQNSTVRSRDPPEQHSTDTWALPLSDTLKFRWGQLPDSSWTISTGQLLLLFTGLKDQLDKRRDPTYHVNPWL